MNDKTQMAKDILKRIEGLHSIAEQVVKVSDPKNNETFEYLLNQLILMSEKLTCAVRGLGLNSQTKKHEEIMKTASDILEINVSKNDGELEICLPSLLPRKMPGKTKFITDPLKHKLKEAANETDLRIDGKAVICFVHVYRENMNSAHCYDYDNLETKNVIDAITLYCLKDDGPEYCEVHHKMQRGSTNKTIIYVTTEEQFFEQFGPR